MVFKALGSIARNMADGAGVVVNDLSHKLFETLAETPSLLTPVLELIADKAQSIPVVMVCHPTGPATDDYHIGIDFIGLDTALKAGTLFRPKIIVRARTAALDRDLLAERMEAALVPFLQAYDTKLVEARKAEANQKLGDAGLFWYASFEFVVSIIGLALLGAGAAIGPLLWLVAGIGGIAFLQEVPGLLFGAVKQLLFGTPIEQLEAEIAAARSIIKRMVRGMKIEVDPNL